MAPLPAGQIGARLRCNNPQGPPPSRSPARSAPAVAQAPPSQATLGQTWLQTPSVFVPNFSSSVVHGTDRNAMCTPIEEDCGMDSRPAGGFVNYLQQSSSYPFSQDISHMPPMFRNFPYFSGSASYAPSKEPKATESEANTFQPIAEPNITHSSPDPHATTIVDVDSGQDNRRSRSSFSKKHGVGSRGGRRMTWTIDETVRLVSAWLKNSNDPIDANWKRNDQYWGAVTAMFNSTTEDDRKRELKQLKEQWHKVNRIVNAFESSWLKAERLRASGESDEQVMDNAMKFYEQDFEEGQFKHIASWKILRDQPKWHTYNEDLNGSNKRKYSDSEIHEPVDFTSSPDEFTDLPRPGGCKKAKEERGSKGKGKATSTTMEEIDKLREGLAKAKEDHVEVLDKHQQIAADRKESARLNHLAAKEKREAKLLEKEGKMHDKESKMLEMYKSLISMDTSKLDDEMKAEHVIATKSLRQKIFANLS